MLIRRLVESDADQFQALRLRGLAEEQIAFASSYEEEVDRLIADVQAQLAFTDSGAIFGGFDEDRLVGVVGLQRESMKKLAHKGYIWGMYISPEARGNNSGTQLLEAALAYAWSDLALAQVNLGVHTENAAAIKVYTSLGFKVFCTERGALRVNGQNQDEHHMVCTAPSAA